MSITAPLPRPAADLHRSRRSTAHALRRLEYLAQRSGRLDVLDWTAHGWSSLAAIEVPMVPRGDRFVRGMRLSAHAIERWRDRVSPHLTLQEAGDELARFVAHATRRPCPRHWMRRSRPAPGDLYLYAAETPGVCAIARSRTVVTVLVRNRNVHS